MAEVFNLTNKTGSTAKVSNLGGIVMSLLIPDKESNLSDIVCGYDQIEEYENMDPDEEVFYNKGFSTDP